MTYEHVIFDLDGTLIDSAQITGSIIDQMLAERGARASADRGMIKAMDAIGGEAMIAAVMGQYTSDPAADIKEFRKRHRSIAVTEDVLFPGVAEALAELRDKGASLAICSNKPQFLCEKILGDLEILRHFTVIIGSTPERARKPDPAKARLALHGLCAAPEATLFCGDSIIDIATARAAALDVCLVSWGYGTAHAMPFHPEIPVLHTMAELGDLVHANQGSDPLPWRCDPG